MAKREEGSAAFVAIAAFAALTLSTMYVKNLSVQSRNAVSTTERNMSLESAQNENLSNLSMVRGMFSPAKLSAMTWEPAIYPKNYFDDNWQLQKNELRPTGAFSVTNSLLTLNSFGPKANELNNAEEIFQATKTQLSELKTPKTILIKRANRDAHHYYYISSIDVVATNSVELSRKSKEKSAVQTAGRIFLPPPEPGPARLEIAKANSTNWSENFGDAANPLLPDKYKFRVVASGIVLSADVTSSGGANFPSLGMNGTQITHKANNIRAVDEVLGETTVMELGEEKVDFDYEEVLQPAATGASGTVTHNGSCSFSIDTSAATAAPAVSTPTSTETITSSTQKTVAVPMDITVTIYRVDGKPSSQSFSRRVYLSSVVTTNKGIRSTVAAGTGGATKPAAGGGPACRDRCPRARDSLADSEWLAFLDKSAMGSEDKTTLDLYRAGESAWLPPPGGAICGNLELVAQDLTQALGYSRPSDIYITNTKWHIFEERVSPKGLSMKYERLYAYVPPACVRQLVGLRDSCGCFEASTMIRMADGTERFAADIRQGDMLWNPMTQRAQAVKRVIAGPEKPALYSLKIAGRVLEVTQEHPFLTTEGMKPANALRVGDQIIDHDEMKSVEEVNLAKRRPGAPDPVVWNFELEGGSTPDDHYVLANGIMTGDLYLQIQLKKGKLSGNASQTEQTHK